jgi:shikimate dehydrogenase
MLVLDLIYNRTRLLRDADAAGATVADGELMLLHQGAAAFTLWTGRPAPIEVMQRALSAARAGGLRSAEGEPTGEPVAAGPAAEPAAPTEPAAATAGSAADAEPVGN